ncbi:MAG: hypothetical protein Q7S08_00225 [bacterium]|nr:hypothetical protein [bacterium]
MKHNTAVFAWTAAVAAVAAWVAVFMYASWISAELDARVSQTADVQSVSERAIAAIRLHALARDTQIERAQLDNLTHSDVIGVANTIDSIGKIAGVALKIGGATPESSGQKKGANGTPALHAISFVVEASGTFSSLMHAAALLETLPSLSSVQSMEFEHVALSGDSKSSKSSSWRLTARIRMLTTADISS